MMWECRHIFEKKVLLIKSFFGFNNKNGIVFSASIDCTCTIEPSWASRLSIYLFIYQYSIHTSSLFLMDITFLFTSLWLILCLIQLVLDRTKLVNPYVSKYILLLGIISLRNQLAKVLFFNEVVNFFWFIVIGRQSHHLVDFFY